MQWSYIPDHVVVPYTEPYSRPAYRTILTFYILIYPHHCSVLLDIKSHYTTTVSNLGQKLGLRGVSSAYSILIFYIIQFNILYIYIYHSYHDHTSAFLHLFSNLSQKLHPDFSCSLPSLYKQLPAIDLFKLLPPPQQTFLYIFPRLSYFRPSTIRQTTLYLPSI